MTQLNRRVFLQVGTAAFAAAACASPIALARSVGALAPASDLVATSPPPLVCGLIDDTTPLPYRWAYKLLQAPLARDGRMNFVGVDFEMEDACRYTHFGLYQNGELLVASKIQTRSPGPINALTGDRLCLDLQIGFD